jgi:hypothetical protein
MRSPDGVKSFIYKVGILGVHGIVLYAERVALELVSAPTVVKCIDVDANLVFIGRNGLTVNQACSNPTGFTVMCDENNM